MKDVFVTEEAGQLLMHLPFPLKDAFRAIFKTAEWNSSKRAFVARATAANRNKWAQFTAEVAALEGTFARADEVAATEAELAALTSEVVATRLRVTQANERISGLKVQIDAAKRVAEELRPILEACTENELRIAAEAESAAMALEEATAPARAVFDRYDVESVLARMARAGNRGYPGKSELERLQPEIIACLRDLRKVGYDHKLLAEVADISLNRAEKFPEAVARATAMLLTGLTKA